MIAVRTYCIPETALVNCVYYHKYSQHRCNLALDTDLDVGVYGFTDAESTLASMSGGETQSQEIVLGVLAGYLHKSQKKKGIKVSLDPRSCKLLGFFAQVHVPSGAPFVLGEEDKISLRLDPEDLGVFSHRFSKIWNMSKPTEVLSLNTSGHIWAGAALCQAIIEQIQDVVALIRYRKGLKTK